MTSRSQLPSRRSGRASAAGLVLLATVLSACGSSGKPAAERPTTGDAHTANVTVTAKDGCVSDRTSFPAGALTVKVANKDAAAVSEVEILSGGRIVGEKENLPPGFEGSFAVKLDGGKYTLYCPGAATERSTFTVTGSADSSTSADVQALLDQGTKDYATYVNTQLGYLVSTTEAFRKALQGTDLAAAQTAYMKARVYYEKIEPVAESFTVGKNDLDANIDAREGDVPAAQWTGFHAIEKGLFQAKSLDGLAPLGAGLVRNVKNLQHLPRNLT